MRAIRTLKRVKHTSALSLSKNMHSHKNPKSEVPILTKCDPSCRPGITPPPYRQHDHIRTCLVQFSMKTHCPPLPFPFLGMLFIYEQNRHLPRSTRKTQRYTKNASLSRRNKRNTKQKLVWVLKIPALINKWSIS